MVVIQTAQNIRIYPTKEQVRYFWKSINYSRFVWNWSLAEWNKWYQEYKDGIRSDKPSGFALSKIFTKVYPEICQKDGKVWITNVYRSTYEREFKNLQTAWKNFFSNLKKGIRAGRPRFKCRDNKGEFYVHNSLIKILDDRVYLGKKVGWVKIAHNDNFRYLEKIMSGTISFDGLNWYISLQFDLDNNPFTPAKKGTIGIDLGCVHLAVTSDGKFYDLPDTNRLEKRLIRQQKSLSRKWSGKPKKGHSALLDENNNIRPKSNKFKRQALRVAKLYKKIKNIKTNAIHNITNEITKNYDVIFIEDLKIKNMTKKAKGKGKAAKSGLNKRILHSSMAEFRRQLEYKAKWRGGCVTAIDPKYTSQRCPKCEHIEADNRKTQDKFSCINCGFTQNADLSAAENIAKIGMATLNGEVIPKKISKKSKPKVKPGLVLA